MAKKVINNIMWDMPEEKTPTSSLFDSSLFEDDGTWDKNGDINLNRVKANRNPNWQPINYDLLTEKYGKLSQFVYLMVENQCKDTESAIRAIENLKKNNSEDDLYYILKSEENRDRARTRYVRTHYNDLEDDKEKDY